MSTERINRNPEAGGSRLHALSDLKNFKVDKNDTDIRGWKVIAGDGTVIGKVEELLADVDNRKVRYADIEIKDEIAARDHREHHVLVPIGLIQLVENSKKVLVKELERTNLHNYPVYDGNPDSVTRDYEFQVRDFITGESSAPSRPEDDFYAHKHFKSDGW